MPVTAASIVAPAAAPPDDDLVPVGIPHVHRQHGLCGEERLAVAALESVAPGHRVRGHVALQVALLEEAWKNIVMFNQPRHNQRWKNC